LRHNTIGKNDGARGQATNPARIRIDEELVKQAMD